MSFSRNVDARQRDLMCLILGVTCTSDHGKYLGCPSFVGRSKKWGFAFIKDRVWSRLSNW